MAQHSIRLQMVASEPWEFGTGPVTMEVLEMLGDDRWLVSVLEGWPTASEIGQATLQARYEGETLVPVLQGEQVVGNLSLNANSRSHGVVGRVNIVP